MTSLQSRYLGEFVRVGKGPLLDLVSDSELYSL